MRERERTSNLSSFSLVFSLSFAHFWQCIIHNCLLNCRSLHYLALGFLRSLTQKILLLLLLLFKAKKRGRERKKNLKQIHSFLLSLSPVLAPSIASCFFPQLTFPPSLLPLSFYLFFILSLSLSFILSLLSHFLSPSLSPSLSNFSYHNHDTIKRSCYMNILARFFQRFINLPGQKGKKKEKNSGFYLWIIFSMTSSCSFFFLFFCCVLIFFMLHTKFFFYFYLSISILTSFLVSFLVFHESLFSIE